MSKASEWAVHAATQPRPFIDENFLEAHVSDHGDLIIESGVKAYSPERALRFARWILATFGENPD